MASRDACENCGVRAKVRGDDYCDVCLEQYDISPSEAEDQRVAEEDQRRAEQDDYN